MCNETARILRRLRLGRGWSWAEEARALREAASRLGLAGLAATSPASVQRTIARWEAGTSTPGPLYQSALAHVFAWDAAGDVSVGPGSDFAALRACLEAAGADSAWLDEVAVSATLNAARCGGGLLPHVGERVRTALAAALAHPERVPAELVADLRAACATADQQIGAVPFVRLYVAQAGLADAVRRLLRVCEAAPRRDLWEAAAAAVFALGGRLAFEVRDDAAALAFYEEAVRTARGADPVVRARIRTGQAMVVHYATGDVRRASRIAEYAVRDADTGGSRLVLARALALRAEMAARVGEARRARAALHRAWHEVERAEGGDPVPGAFSAAALNGFAGVCGVFLGEAAESGRALALSAAALDGARDAVQKSIVLSDVAVARLRAGGDGAAEEAAALLHEVVELVGAHRGRVGSGRLREARGELGPWRARRFVAELDDRLREVIG